MAEGGSKRINVVVKTPKDKKTVEVDEDSGIKDVSICICGYVKIHGHRRGQGQSNKTYNYVQRCPEGWAHLSSYVHHVCVCMCACVPIIEGTVHFF